MKKETFILLNIVMNKIDIKNKISDLFISRDNDGTYNLFGNYVISTINGQYHLAKNDDSNILIFYSLKHAVTWCVFDKANKYKEVKRVHELDNDIVSADALIANYNRLMTSCKNSNKYIYKAKLSEQKLKKRKMLEEINDFTGLSKYMQSKKFAENQHK
jgi:hypothetical protein